MEGGGGGVVETRVMERDRKEQREKGEKTQTIPSEQALCGEERGKLSWSRGGGRRGFISSSKSRSVPPPEEAEAFFLLLQQLFDEHSFF